MDWHDPNRECHCRLEEPASDDRGLDEQDRLVLANVTEFGWHIVQIRDDPMSAGWVFSVGMWHTLGSPELAMFGMEPAHAGNAINLIGDHVRAGRHIGHDVTFDDILAENRLVAFRPAHQSWYPPLFGYATWFAQRPPLPIAQMVWADTEGRFPWDADVEATCRLAQPSLWVPVDQHPPSRWSGALIGKDWPFPEPPTTPAFTTRRVAFDHSPVLWVLHEANGDWQFLDGGSTNEDDIAVIHLVHAAGLDPTIIGLADLPRGWEARRARPDEAWARRPLAES